MSSYLETRVALALGRALVHFLWEGALIALLLAVTLWLARGRGGLGGRRRSFQEMRACPAALFRYTAASLTLLAMAMSFVLTFAILIPATPPSLTIELTLPMPPPALPATPASVSTTVAGDAQWTVLVWLAGVLVVYARSVAGWISVQRLRRTGICGQRNRGGSDFRN